MAPPLSVNRHDCVHIRVVPQGLLQVPDVYLDPHPIGYLAARQLPDVTAGRATRQTGRVELARLPHGIWAEHGAPTPAAALTGSTPSASRFYLGVVHPGARAQTEGL